MEKEIKEINNIMPEDLDLQIKQAQANLSELIKKRELLKAEPLQHMIRGYFKSLLHPDTYFYVDFIGSDIKLPHGFEVTYKEIRCSRMDFPKDWIAISRADFNEKFAKTCAKLIVEMKLKETPSAIKSI